MESLPGMPNGLSHEQREREAQFAAKHAALLSLPGLRIARARLADLLEKGDVHPELIERATIRGQVIHAEIQRRENPAGGSFLRTVSRIAFGLDDERELKKLTAF
jgi:hypothetical protein